MPMLEECWIVLDATGDVIAEATTHEGAVKWALKQGLSPVVDEFDGYQVEMGLAANPREGARYRPSRELAMRAMPIPRVSLNDVRSLSIEDAYETIFDYYPRIRSAGASPLIMQDSVSKLCKSFLGTNFKTAKEVSRGRPGSIKGLSLAPSVRWLDTLRSLRAQGKLRVALETLPPPDKKWMLRFLELTEDLDTPTPSAQGAFDHCVGASTYCRSCCLSGTGHGSSPHNMIKKVVLSTLLIQHPVEFFLMLHEAIRRHAVSAKKAGKEPMVRLNVFSDLPWEKIVPWLLDPESYDGTRVQFYDYTKLVGRGPQASKYGTYDITFSFAGDNQDLTWEELRRGTRVAAVFAGKHMPKIGGKLLWLDPRASRNTGEHLKVVDGLKDDARPRDPEGSLVALKYKTPVGKHYPEAFILKAWKHPDGYYLCDAHMPTHTNVEEEEEED